MMVRKLFISFDFPKFYLIAAVVFLGGGGGLFAKHAIWLCRQLAGDAKVSQTPAPRTSLEGEQILHDVYKISE